MDPVYQHQTRMRFWKNLAVLAGFTTSNRSEFSLAWSDNITANLQVSVKGLSFGSVFGLTGPGCFRADNFSFCSIWGQIRTEPTVAKAAWASELGIHFSNRTPSALICNGLKTWLFNASWRARISTQLSTQRKIWERAGEERGRTCTVQIPRERKGKEVVMPSTNMLYNHGRVSRIGLGSSGLK